MEKTLKLTILLCLFVLFDGISSDSTSYSAVTRTNTSKIFHFQFAFVFFYILNLQYFEIDRVMLIYF